MEIEIKNLAKPITTRNPQPHHSRAFSSKLESQTEIDIKKKLQKPFWVPNNNSDLFVVKKILNEEREIRREISNNKMKRSRNLNNFHNNVLLTFGKEQMKAATTLYNPLSELEKIKSDKARRIAEEKDSSFHKNIAMKTQNIAQFHNEKISDFITKSRQLSLMKYSMKVKEERILREEETYQNELESIKDSIFSMEKAKAGFEEEFALKFDKYIKYLQNEKEKEKQELENMLYKKTKLDAQLKQLENKKNKQKEKLEQYKEYKVFLISIKERDLSILSQKDLIEKALSINKKLTNNNTFLTQNVDKRPIAKAKKGDVRLKREVEFGAILPNPEVLINIDRIIHKYDKKVFSEPKDLIEEIKTLETLNIDLLQKNNELYDIYYDNHNEFERVVKHENVNMENLKQDNDVKENILRELKERNKRDKEEKESLLLYSEKNLGNFNSKNLGKQNNYSGGNSSKFSGGRNMLLNKINNLYSLCLNLSYYKEKFEKLPENGFDKIKLKNNAAINNNQIDMLRVIEKTFDKLWERYRFFFENKFSQLKAFEKELETERKKKNTEDQKYEVEIKKDNLMKKIIEKYNKASVIPKRKIAEKVRPKTKEKRENKSNNFKLDDINLQDLLTYEDHK